MCHSVHELFQFHLCHIAVYNVKYVHYNMRVACVAASKYQTNVVKCFRECERDGTETVHSFLAGSLRQRLVMS